MNISIIPDVIQHEINSEIQQYLTQKQLPTNIHLDVLAEEYRHDIQGICSKGDCVMSTINVMTLYFQKLFISTHEFMDLIPEYADPINTDDFRKFNSIVDSIYCCIRSTLAIHRLSHVTTVIENSGVLLVMHLLQALLQSVHNGQLPVEDATDVFTNIVRSFKIENNFE